MQAASELYGQLTAAGVLLELGDGGTLVADNTPALAPFVPAIREQKETLRADNSEPEFQKQSAHAREFIEQYAHARRTGITNYRIQALRFE